MPVPTPSLRAKSWMYSPGPHGTRIVNLPSASVVTGGDSCCPIEPHHCDTTVAISSCCRRDSGNVGLIKAPNVAKAWCNASGIKL